MNMATLFFAAPTSAPGPARFRRLKLPALALFLAAAGLALSLALALAGQAGASSARSALAPNVTAQVRFDQPDYFAPLGESITVDLVVDSAQHLAGWELTLSFNPAFVEVAEVTVGDFISYTGRSANILVMDDQAASGLVVIGGYSIGADAGASGSGVLAHIRFDTRGPGQTDLALGDLRLVSPTGVPFSPKPTSVGSQLNVTVSLDVAIAIGDMGNQAELTWLAPPQTSFELWTSTDPYFTPGDVGSSDISADCNNSDDVIACIDNDVIGDPGLNHYYLITLYNAYGQQLTSARLGEFDFALTPGQ